MCWIVSLQIIWKMNHRSCLTLIKHWLHLVVHSCNHTWNIKLGKVWWCAFKIPLIQILFPPPFLALAVVMVCHVTWCLNILIYDFNVLKDDGSWGGASHSKSPLQSAYESVPIPSSRWHLIWYKMNVPPKLHELLNKWMNEWMVNVTNVMHPAIHIYR